MESLRKALFHSPGHYIVALVIAVAVGLFRFSTLPEGMSPWYVCYEVLSVSGYVTFLIGGLMTVSYFGAFDLFGFVFTPRGQNGKKKYKNYTEYTEKKSEDRVREGYFFVPYFAVGIVIVLISWFFA